MAISRMQEPRQLYGLGKLVKKAFKGLKKVAKSPLGKAAIIGGLGWGANKWGPASGWFSRMTGSAPGQGISSFAKKWFNPFNKANPLLYTDNKFSGKKAFGLGAAGLIAAPFIQKAMGYGPYEEVEEEVDDWTVTPSSIANIRAQAVNQDPSLAFLPSSNYAQSGFYAADGGRAGLVNGGEAGQAQMEQMLRAEYMKYRNRGGTMPYEQFKMLVMRQAEQGQMPNQMMAADGGRAGYLLGGEIEKQADLIEGPQGNEEFSETVVEEVGATDQQKAMVHDMLQRGMDHATIAEVTGLDEATVLSIIQETQVMAQGGRAGFKWGGSEAIDIAPLETYNVDEIQDIEKEIGVGPMASDPEAGDDMNQVMEFFSLKLYGKSVDQLTEDEYLNLQESLPDLMGQMTGGDTEFAAQGGRMGFQMGGDDEDDTTYNPYRAMDMYKRTRRQEGGLMDLGGMEKDYRDEGGFVALGGEERADDVPARLSKNEFVFTADAVRNAGGGDIDRGSEVMQNMMDNLEAGGEISEESHGLEGGEEIMSEEIIDESNPAQGMYDNYEQLQSRVG